MKSAPAAMFLGSLIMGLMPFNISAQLGTECSTGNALAAWVSFPEEELLQQSFPGAFRTDSVTLSIVTALGDTLVFTDTVFIDGICYFCSNKLKAFFPEHDYWVVEQNGYEWTDWLLINGSSGRIQRAFSEPVLSPDSRRFLCAYRDLRLGSTLNGIQIWRIEQDSLIPEFSGSDVYWGPSEVEWETDSTVTFQMLDVDWDTWDVKVSTGRLKLSIEGCWTPENPVNWYSGNIL
ncbi:MAG: hypothetical protein KAR44_03070 [Candidatus Aegiribacteria sp.]|nr:hypothetical protein [Candidatus Aegiribacteria sp.]